MWFVHTYQVEQFTLVNILLFFRKAQIQAALFIKIFKNDTISRLRKQFLLMTGIEMGAKLQTRPLTFVSNSHGIGEQPLDSQ